MVKSGFWKGHVERALHSPYLLLLFIASVLLSIASFYTTYVGIIPFVQHEIFGFFITMAIQSLLFVVSWRLGFMFADKEPLALVDVGVFVVCFTLSVFFSFNSLFNVIFAAERQQEASLGRVRDGATEVVNRAERRLKTQLVDQFTALTESDRYRTWRGDVMAVADLAQRAGPDLRARVVEERNVQRREAERLASEASQLVGRQGGLDNEIATLERRLANLDATRPELAAGLPELQARVPQLEIAVTNKKAEMDAEEGGIGETGQSGRGPVWASLEKEQRILQAELRRMRELLALKRSRLAEHDAQHAEVDRQLRATRELADNLTAEIAAARQRSEAARAKLANFGTDGGVEATVQALRDQMSRFEITEDLVHLDRTQSLCNQLYDTMAELERPPPGLTQRSCDLDLTATLVTPIRETRVALAELTRRCTGQEAQSLHALPLEGALDTARACLEITKLPFRQLRDLRNELDRLEREEGPHASEFTQTTNALFAGEKDALFALVIAISIDLLVLFTGLIGAKSASATFATRVHEVDIDDPPDIVAIKTLLKQVNAFSGKLDGVRYEGKIDVSSIGDARDRDLVEQVLVRNVPSGMVRASPEHPTLFHLRYGTLDQLEERLQRLQRLRKAAPAATTRRPDQADRPAADPPIKGGSGIRLYGPNERQGFGRAKPSIASPPIHDPRLRRTQISTSNEVQTQGSSTAPGSSEDQLAPLGRPQYQRQKGLGTSPIQQGKDEDPDLVSRLLVENEPGEGAPER